MKKFKEFRAELNEQFLDEGILDEDGLDEDFLNEAVPIKTNEFMKGLDKEGWTFRKQSGNHDIYVHPRSVDSLPIPRHREITAGVHRSLRTIRDAVLNLPPDSKEKANANPKLQTIVQNQKQNQNKKKKK